MSASENLGAADLPPKKIKLRAKEKKKEREKADDNRRRNVGNLPNRFLTMKLSIVIFFRIIISV